MPNRDIGKHQQISKAAVERIADQVRRNCDVSDAKNAGLYSICGLALRLRDLFKWETGLPPWEEKDSSEILDWIGGREQRWEKLAGENFGSITIRNQHLDPFDTAAINNLLEPHGLFYGAGYAHGLKPTFFLARVEQIEQIDGIAVAILGSELARDLLTIPALSQDHAVVLRQDAARLHLWDKMFYLRKSARPAMRFALQNCGLHDDSSKFLRNHLDTVFEAYRDNYIYHEIGEMRETVFDRKTWREMIALYAQSPVELLVRSIKDLLADTNQHGPLQHIVSSRNAAALGLYVAFIDGLAKEVFSQLTPAFYSFVESGSWQKVRIAVDEGYRKACRITEQIVGLYRTGKKRNQPKWARCAIEQQVLADIIDRRQSAA